MWQISYPSANGVSHGNYFLPNSHNLAVYEEKQTYINSSGVNIKNKKLVFLNL